MIEVNHPGTRVLDPAYWNLDGADIVEAVRTLEPMPYLFASPKEERLATRALAVCLGSIMQGERVSETKPYFSNSFDPTKDQCPEYTVIVLDTESLDLESMAYHVILPSFSPIRTPYAQYWRHQQGRGTNFGCDITHFPDARATYVRSLEWGVILPRKLGRVVMTWPLPGPIFAEDMILIPGHSPAERKVTQLPISLSTHSLEGTEVANARKVPRITRLSGVTLVNVVEQDEKRTKAPNTQWKFPKLNLGRRLGGITLPEPA